MNADGPGLSWKRDNVPPLQTSYPSLRENLHPSFQRMSDQRIESFLEQSGIDAEMAEGFFSDLGKVASSIGKAAISAAPSILPVAGTVIGTAFGGPLGASLGGTLGRVAGGAISGGAGGAASAAAGGISSLLGGGGGGVSSLLGGGGAAGKLLQTITRPETLNALMSMMLGPAGKPSIPVGATPVPVGAFSNLISVLSNRAAAEYNSSIARPVDAAPAYLRDYAGEATADAAVPEQRADALFELLELTQSEQESEVAESEAEAFEAFEVFVEAQAEAEAEAWELFDAIDAFESE
jgi:hypothetical protein